MVSVIEGPVGVEPAFDFAEVIEADHLQVDFDRPVVFEEFLIGSEGFAEEEEGFGESELGQFGEAVGHFLGHHEDLVLAGAGYKGFGLFGELLATIGSHEGIVVVLSHFVDCDLFFDIDI